MGYGNARELSDRIVQMYSQRSSRILDDIATPDFRFWDNVDAIDKSRDVIKAEFDQYIGQFKSVYVTVLRMEELHDGFLQQYVVSATRHDDRATRDRHVCLVVRTRDGKISRIDEYCDSAVG